MGQRVFRGDEICGDASELYNSRKIHQEKTIRIVIGDKVINIYMHCQIQSAYKDGICMAIKVNIPSIVDSFNASKISISVCLQIIYGRYRKVMKVTEV